MTNITDLALNMISRNPRISQNPNFREYIDVIRRGDSVRGQQIADNLCRSYGSSRDETIANARRYFHI